MCLIIGVRAQRHTFLLVCCSSSFLPNFTQLTTPENRLRISPVFSLAIPGLQSASFCVCASPLFPSTSLPRLRLFQVSPHYPSSGHNIKKGHSVNMLTGCLWLRVFEHTQAWLPFNLREFPFCIDTPSLSPQPSVWLTLQSCVINYFACGNYQTSITDTRNEETATRFREWESSRTLESCPRGECKSVLQGIQKDLGTDLWGRILAGKCVALPPAHRHIWMCLAKPGALLEKEFDS